MGCWSCSTSLSLKVFLFLCIAHVSYGSSANGPGTKSSEDGGGNAEGISDETVETTSPLNEEESLQIDTASHELQQTAQSASRWGVRSATGRVQSDSLPSDTQLTVVHPHVSLPLEGPVPRPGSRWRGSLSPARRFFTALRANLALTREVTMSNRFVLLACYLFYALLATACLFGWSSTSRIVARQGGFSDSCNNGTEFATNTTLEHNDNDYLCQEQKQQVEHFYRDVRLVSGLVAGFAGMLYNALGPRLIAVIGQTLNIASWSLLALSSSSFRYHSYALILMGSAVAFSVFPFVSLRSLFPERPHFILTVLGTAVSYSGVTPMILDLAQRRSGLDQRSVILAYIILGLLPSFFIAVSLMPERSSPHRGNGAAWTPEALEIAEGFAMDEAGEHSFTDLAEGLVDPAPHRRGLITSAVNAERPTLHRRRPRPTPTAASPSTSFRSPLRRSRVFHHLREALSVHFVLILLHLLGGYASAEFFSEINTGGPRCQETTWGLTEHLATFFWCVLQGNAVTSAAVVRTMVSVSIFGWLMHFIPLVASGPEAESAAEDLYLLFRPFFRWHSFTAIERAFGTSASASLAGFATMVSEILHYVIRTIVDKFVETSSARTILRGVFLAVHSLQFLLLYFLSRLGRRRPPQNVIVESDETAAGDGLEHTSEATSTEEDEEHL